MMPNRISTGRFLVLIAGLLLVGLTTHHASSAVSAQADTASDGPFWRLVDESLTLFEAATPSDSEIDQLIDRWQTLEAESGPVDPVLIIRQLEQGSEAAESSRAMFEALQRSRETWPVTTLPAEPGDPAARLDQILAAEVYQYDVEEESWIQRRLRRWRSRLEGWLAGLFADRAANAGQRQGPSAIAADPLIGLVGLFAAIILGAILIQLFQRLSLGLNQAGVEEREVGSIYEPLTIDQALERADQTAKSGDYRHSVRYLYLSTILILEEKEILKPDRSQTNQEYLQAVEDNPQISTVLKRVVQVFDRVWYGKADIDEPTLRRYEQEIKALQASETETKVE